MHYDFQNTFALGLLAPTPLTDSKRFAVHRNNFYVGLVEALRARFPAVQDAVGSQFFAALARDYAADHPPDSPLMMNYGESFPDYIEAFPPLSDYPWMGDMARVECAMTHSYHAPDATPLLPTAFSSLAADDLGQLRLTLHPAVRLVPSRFPVVSLWKRNTVQASQIELDAALAQTALICRPHYDVTVKALNTAGGVFLRALQGGRTLADSLDQAAAVDPAFDVTSHLHTLIADGLVTHFALHPATESPS